jgi:hypothetical protein
MAWWVAAVGEPAGDIGFGEGGEGGPGGGAEVVVGAGFGATEALLDLGEIHPMQMANVGGSETELMTIFSDAGYDVEALDERNPLGIYHALVSPVRGPR